MPRVDGYEATRRIRKREPSGNRDSRSEVPIIALTADALPADREACLAAGMNDFLPKPLKREKLFAAVRKWLPDATAASNDSAQAVDHQADSPAISETLRLDRAKIAASFGGDSSLTARILEEYQRTSPAQVEKMEQARQQRASKELKEIAHAFKGSSAYLQVAGLYDLSGQVNQAARISDWEEVDRLLPELKTAHLAVLQQIESSDKD